MSFDIQDIQWLRKLSPEGSPELYQIGSKLYNALVSIQTAVGNIEQQTNTNATGMAQAPPPIQGVKVDARNGIFHISINHEAPFQRGIQYHAEYADNPNFANPFPIAMGTNREWRGSLGAGTFHFRVAASYGISPPTDWVYHGGIQPKPVDGGGLPGPALPRLSQGSGTGAPGQGLQGPGTQPVRQPGVGNSGPRDPSPYTSFARFKPIIIRSGGVSGASGGGGGGGGGTGITQLTGDVTAGPGAGSQAATLANTAVVAGSYIYTNLTVDSKGRITAASNGSVPNNADNEIPSGTVNGVNVTFTLAHTPNPSTSAKGYVNGARQNPGVGNDFTISGATITFAVAPPTSSIILFDYRY